MSDFATSVTQTASPSINAAHPLPPVDLTQKLKANDGTYRLGTLLKRDGNGVHSRYMRGTDNANTIVGVYSHHLDVDTAKQVSAMVRDFGPIALQGLKVATVADGSTLVAPNAAELAALKGLRIYAL